MSKLAFLILLACTKQHEEKASLPASSVEAATAETTAPSVKVTTEATAAPLQVSEAQAGVSNEAVRVSGQVIATRKIQASFKVGGHIAKTLIREGDVVRAGQTLAVLDDRDFSLRAQLATVAVDQTKIALDQAKKDADREEVLRKENATSLASFERITNGLRNAEFAIRQAKLNAEQAAKALDDTKLTAPFTGVLVKQLKFDGEYVGVGAPVFEMYDLERIEVSLRVPESLFPRVKIGNVIDINVPSLNRKGQLKLNRVVPFIQENSRTFEVLGKISGHDLTLVPGQFIEAML